MATLYIDNDMQLALSGDGRLKDQDGNPVIGAAVEATLYEGDGTTEVAGVTWPLTLQEESEDGVYSTILPASAEVAIGQPYLLVITAESPGGARAKWRERVDIQHRDF